MKGGKQESRIIPPQFTERQWDRTVQVLRLTPTEANVVALVLSGRADKEMQGEMKMAYGYIQAEDSDHNLSDPSDTASVYVGP